MNQHDLLPFRLMAIALTTRGLGFGVLEGEKSLVESGHTSVGKDDKNVRCLAKIKKLITRYRPDALILQDVTAKDSRRRQRIKILHRQVMAFAIEHKLRVALISETQLRILLLANANGTKHEIAEILAKQFPDELVLWLPPKRRAWDSADSRMDIFDAVALAVAFRIQKGGEV